MAACDRCLRRTWLLERLTGHLDRERRHLLDLLALPDHDLIAAVTNAAARSEIEREWAQAPLGCLVERHEQTSPAALEIVCRCDPRYPRRLLDLDAPPHVLHVAGGVDRLQELTAGKTVAIVGTRRPSPDGAAVASRLGQALSGCGVTVISGMALGIDAAAHDGAVDGGGATLAVLPGSVLDPYPQSKRKLYRRILAAGGVAVSELGVTASARPWTFVARNRTVAALGDLLVVVEAKRGSGSEVTARVAQELGRPLGAVPGSVTRPQAEGPNELLVRGGHVIRDAQDALDVLYGAGVQRAPADDRPAPTAAQAAILAAVASGADTIARLAGAGIDAQAALIEVSSLELAGRLRRGAGGSLSVLP